jgi:hypothetical protein
MTKAELSEMIGILDEIRKLDANQTYLQLEMLRDDLQKRYLDEYDNLEKVYRTAWDEAVKRRLEGITLIGANMVKDFNTFKTTWKARAKTCALKIYFGQMRVGPEFQGALNNEQNTILGFPKDDVVGKQISVVSGSITNKTILPDQIPVQIFYLASEQKWIAANNRGYTAYCRAKVQPLRLWPRKPESAETKRLKEKEGTGDTGTFTYPAQLPDRLGDNPRTLPSLEMPVTTGPNTWVVQEIIKVPSTFN